jgi:hypothetical protein
MDEIWLLVEEALEPGAFTSLATQQDKAVLSPARLSTWSMTM